MTTEEAQQLQANLEDMEARVRVRFEARDATISNLERELADVNRRLGNLEDDVGKLST